MASVARAFLAAVNLLYAAAFGGPIDGTAWSVQVRQAGFFHWGSRQETLVFHDGRAVIAGAVAQGYATPYYDARPAADGTDFTVRLDDGERDPVVWTGRIRDGRIAGQVLIGRQGGRVTRYEFTGAQKSG